MKKKILRKTFQLKTKKKYQILKLDVKKRIFEKNINKWVKHENVLENNKKKVNQIISKIA